MNDRIRIVGRDTLDQMLLLYDTLYTLADAEEQCADQMAYELMCAGLTDLANGMLKLEGAFHAPTIRVIEHPTAGSIKRGLAKRPEQPYEKYMIKGEAGIESNDD